LVGKCTRVSAEGNRVSLKRLAVEPQRVVVGWVSLLIAAALKEAQGIEGKRRQDARFSSGRISE
jgi:hypothetical protein